MGKPLAGEVVVLPFPQTNLQAGKRRPALVIASLPGDDLILCQITSQSRDRTAVPITAADFEHGRLPLDSFVRVGRLFTADQSVVLYSVGKLREAKVDEVHAGILGTFAQSSGANPFAKLTAFYAEWIRRGKNWPLGKYPNCPRPRISVDAAKALIFSPHPDDEVIIGGIALRLMREAGWNVINVAVTQGSNQARQAERWEELKQCCECIGFGLVQTAPGGLEKVNVKTREQEPAHWAQSVKVIADILQEHQPRAILFPHDDDWNSSHIGTHHLVVDALKSLGPGFTTYTVETEFWGAMKTPNLMVEISASDLADLITALTFHVGEVKRNPYHLSLPAWMIDNVRRGSEVALGQGGVAPDFTFATLYRLRRWTNGGFEKILHKGCAVSQTEDLTQHFQ